MGPETEFNRTAAPSQEVREQTKNMVLTIIGAIILAFLVGIISTTVSAYFASFNETELLLIASVILAVIISYLLFFFYVFRPYSSINKSITLNILFDKDDGKILDDVFDGYVPQGMALTAFKRYSKDIPDNVRIDRVKEVPYPSSFGSKPHIFTDLVVCIMIHSLRNLMDVRFETKLEPNIKKELPKEFDDNTVISYFKKMEGHDIVDAALKQLDFIMPADVKIGYKSPAPLPNYFEDPNTFEIRFKGKSCDIRVHGMLVGIGPQNNLVTGPYSILDGVYIRKYWLDKIMKNFGGLWNVSFLLTVRANFRLRRGYLSYMDWANGWISGFTSSFDFNAFRESKLRDITFRIFETVSTIKSRVVEDYDSD